MNTILVIGSGIAGLSCANTAAQAGAAVLLVSPLPSERSQSVMAAGGINGALDHCGENDSIEAHIADTIAGGCFIADPEAVRNMCESAPRIIMELAALGTEFHRNERGEIAQRAFGGQNKRRTAYAGTSTGKQIVTALTREARRYEAEGKIDRRMGLFFLDLIISNGRAAGAVLLDRTSGEIFPCLADAVVFATGGQNSMFGKTTGSTLCDGAACASAFLRGARLKNLEMIQYHPTTIETPLKRMLVSEAARGEGGRLYYEDGGRRVYFIEEKYPGRGNLMPRDVVSREIYETGRQIYLDITFLGKEHIMRRLREVYDVCMTYARLDVTKTPIPVAPSVHYFMGGLSVDASHQTSIPNLFAAGECAAIYHGANRLGGNSLLGAIYGGYVAAQSALGVLPGRVDPALADAEARRCRERMDRICSDKSSYPCVYVINEASSILNTCLGISRSGDKLHEGVSSLDYYIDVTRKLVFDPHVDSYRAYMCEYQLLLAKAMIMSALAREESRGAHYRTDFPNTREEFRAASVAAWGNDRIDISFVREEPN